MKNTISSFLKVAGVACFSLITAAEASAQVATVIPNVTISKIRTGWAGDAFGLETVGTPISNPAGCATPDGYMSEISQPGYKTYLMMVTMAMATEKKVSIVVSNTECILNRPKVWGIYVEQQ